MIRRPPRSTRTDNTLSLHGALPIYCLPRSIGSRSLARTWHSTCATSLPPRSRRATVWRLPVRMRLAPVNKSEEHTSELQSLIRLSYAVFCWKKKTNGHLDHLLDRLATLLHDARDKRRQTQQN